MIHGDLDRSWQALRHGNLSNLAQDVVAATEAGIKPIAEGAAALRVKGDHMLSGLAIMRADLRELPRYEVRLTARLQQGDQMYDVAVQDISEGGARIAKIDRLAVGDAISLTLPGIDAIAGEIVRDGGDNVGVQFKPSRLRLEELRNLVTAPEYRAA